MYREAEQSAETVERQLELNTDAIAALVADLQARPPRAVITCARGSSDHAATFAKYLIETRLGILTSSAAPSVSSVYFARQNLNDCLLLAISQSGKSPDLLATAKAAHQAGALVIALVNDPDSPLARMADHCIALQAGPERSVAATKSYIAALAAVIHLVSHWSCDDALQAALRSAPSLLREAWRLDWSATLPMLLDTRHLFVMGRGLGLGIALEAALKCKETSALHAEGFSSAEVQHGPQALLGPDFPALLLAQQDETLAGIRQVAQSLIERGVPVAIAGSEISGALNLPTLSCHPVIQPLLLALSFYKLVNRLSVARGLDPDQPAHLRKITETV
jgi:glucosamine--fructose-6-phosphate aminotransferase (isomerizing)